MLHATGIDNDGVWSLKWRHAASWCISIDKLDWLQLNKIGIAALQNIASSSSRHHFWSTWHFPQPPLFLSGFSRLLISHFPIILLFPLFLTNIFESVYFSKCPFPKCHFPKVLLCLAYILPSGIFPTHYFKFLFILILIAPFRGNMVIFPTGFFANLEHLSFSQMTGHFTNQLSSQNDNISNVHFAIAV